MKEDLRMDLKEVFEEGPGGSSDEGVREDVKEEAERDSERGVKN